MAGPGTGPRPDGFESLLYAILFSAISVICPGQLILLHMITSDEECNSKAPRFAVNSPCYILAIRSTYFPQYLLFRALSLCFP